MDILDLHPWDVDPTEARRIQEEFRARLDLTDHISLADIRHVAGTDNAYVRADAGNAGARFAGTTAYAAAIVLSYPELEIVETSLAHLPVTFPYVPGLLAFREAPAVIAAFRGLDTIPDVVLADAQGYAHFRRFGFASHLGLVLGIPTIGCAKARLVGR